MNGGGGRQRPEEDGEQHLGDEPPRPTAGDREVSGGEPWSDSWGDDAYLDELFGPRPGRAASAPRQDADDSGGFGTDGSDGFGTDGAGGFGGSMAGFDAAKSAGSAPGFGTDGSGEPPSGRGEPIRIDDDWSDPAPSGRAGTDEPGPGVLRLYAGDLLLTFGGADGTDVAPVPAGARPPRSSRLPGSVPSTGPEPLGRGVEIAELTGLLQRGTSVRIGGPASSGRTTLLRRLAALDPAQAPDGVILLDGRRRGLDDLLQQLHDACFAGPAYRPTRVQLARILADVAALVVIDDLDIGQEDIAELLRIAPECAFLVAGPEQVDPIARRDSPLHEITLRGLPQEASFDLLRRVAGRELDDEELSWASALWFQVGGHPGRFVQAGALLARRERGRYGLLDDGAADGSAELPSPGEPRQFVPRLVPLVSASAQQVLRLASALDGELPDPVHLPALTGAVDAVGAADELVEAGLAACEFGRYRLTGGTAEAVASIVRGPSSWAVAAIQHFTWWVSHPSVTPAEIAREADTILACLRESERLGKAGSARALARASAPAFGASARWDTWGEVLELGLASAREAGASAAVEHAWFRHELAVLALCTGDPEGAREEAVAATRMRDVGSDKRGLAADRRVLALAGGDRTAVAAVGQEGATGAERGGIGRRGVLMTAGAAVVLVVTLAAVVAMGSDSPDRGDQRNPVGSTGSATYDPNTPNRGPEADPRVDRDKPPPPTGSRKPGASGATSSAATTARETTAPNTSAPATAPRSSTPANSASQSTSPAPTSAPPTTTRAPSPTSTTPQSPVGDVNVPVGA